MKSLEDIALKQRWLRRHPGEKALLAFGLLVVCLATSIWQMHAGIFLLASASLVLSARIPFVTYIKVLALPLSFLLASAGTLFVSLHFPDGYAPVFALVPEAWKTVLVLVSRSMAAFSCLLLFSLTTPLPDALYFFRRCGMPKAVLEAALLTYNMFTVLCDSAARMLNSQEARLGYATLRAAYHSLGMLAANLLVQAVARAKRLETGLESRGFTGELTVLVEFVPLSRPRVAGYAVLLAALFVVEFAL